jgi:ethanolamine-phosphate cytidylyltransferase
MRQAKKLGDILVIGVISDEEILRCKGPPVMNLDERKIMAEACKWVDEVQAGVEYYVTPAILERFNCDYVVHGDDLAIRKDTGTDAYQDVR